MTANPSLPAQIRQTRPCHPRAHELAQHVGRGNLKAVEVLAWVQQRLKLVDPDITAFESLDPTAEAQAQHIGKLPPYHRATFLAQLMTCERCLKHTR